MTKKENDGSESDLSAGLGPRILHLTLKKKWFDMIASGVKKEEYRETKPYWDKRLMGRSYDVIRFRNGYAKDAPTLIVEYKGLDIALGVIEWGAPGETPVYILELGEILGAYRLN